MGKEKVCSSAAPCEGRAGESSRLQPCAWDLPARCRLEGQGRAGKFALQPGSGLCCRSLGLRGNFSRFCQLLPGSPITPSLGSAVSSFPCRHLQHPSSTQFGKNCSSGLLSSGERMHLWKPPASASTPWYCKPPVPASLGWGSGCQEGHPCCWKSGSPSLSLLPVHPSVPPQAMGSVRPPGPRRLCCSNYSSRTRRRGPPTKLRSIFYSSPIDAID